MGLIKECSPDQGYLGPQPTKHTYRYNRVGDRVEETRTVVVYNFTLGDVEDPEIYAAEPLMEWQKSEAGQWVMKNAVETPIWQRAPDFATCGYKYRITAKLQGAKLTEWLMRYGNGK